MFRPIAATVVVGVSLLGAGAGLLYLLLKQDDDLLSLTYENSKRQRQSIEVPIPKDSVGILIGRSGANIKEIQEKTGTRITFKDESPDAAFRICVIRGLPEKAQLAETMVLEFLASQPKIESVEIWVPQKACGRIIGRAGSTIRAMVKASGAKINLESGDEDNEIGDRRIVLRGTAAQIALAKSLIDEKVEEDGELRRSVECNPRAPRSPSRQLCITSAENANGGNNDRKSVERLLSSSQGGFLEVYVSAMNNPSRFWIQKVGPPSVELDKLVERMTEFYSQEENQEVYRPKDMVEDGDMVAAQFTVDQKWYRGMVIDVKPDEYDPAKSQISVYFVDYGDEETKFLSEICRLKIEFLQLRHQAIECCLAGVQPTGDDWSEEASDLFEELTNAALWIPLMAKVQGYREQPRRDRATSPVPVVDLINTSRSQLQDTNVAEELIRQKFAAACPNTAQNGMGTPTLSKSSIAISPTPSNTSTTTSKTVALPAGEEDWDDDSDF